MVFHNIFIAFHNINHLDTISQQSGEVLQVLLGLRRTDSKRKDAFRCETISEFHR